MDHNVTSTERYINDEMESAELACVECAVANGHTAQEAENCDDGSVGCPDCPFVKRPTPRAADRAYCTDPTHIITDFPGEKLICLKCNKPPRR